MNRVVVTGMGAVTPIGNNITEFWKGIKDGKCGVEELTAFNDEHCKTKFAAEVKNLDLEEILGKKEVRRIDRNVAFAIIAAREAVNDANINLKSENNTINPERVGVVVSSGIGGLITIQNQCIDMYKTTSQKVSPFFIPMAIANMASGNISIETGAKGESFCIVTACASGTHSIGESYRLIKHGYQDIMITGGCEASIIDVGIAGFVNMKALSSSITDKSRASIPFDKERSGFVMGEGAGVLVLEELDHAIKRGAKIYAEIVGYGASSDAYHITSPLPEGEGGRRAMQNAINDANISADKITYINAHGTSTPINDKLETMAIKNLMGQSVSKVFVSSTKSMTGHLLGAAGAVEAIVCIKAVQEDYVPATINLKVPDPECDLNYVPNVGINTNVEYAMSNSLGFGGHNSSVIFKKFN